MRNHPTSLMIFAAGFGTRMGDLTKDRPKPLIEVAGRPLIDHALELADQAGIETVVANIHYLPDQMRAHLEPKGVSISDESDVILETGGGLKKARERLGGDACYTLNSDAVWTGLNPLTELAAAWRPDEMDALLLLLDPEDATGHVGTGDFLKSGTQLERGPGFVYSGAQIIKTSLLDDIPDTAFSLNLLWDRLIAIGRLHGTLHTGGWCDVGHKEGIAAAEALLNYDRDV